MRTAARLWMRRPWVRRVVLPLLVAVAGSLSPAAPAAGENPVGTLSLSGPTTVPLGVATAYGGTFSLLTGTVGVPKQEIQLRVDGTTVATAESELDGEYGAEITFTSYGAHDVQAVAHAGSSLETRSPILHVEVVPTYDPTVSTDLFEATKFLYMGPHAVQTGVSSGTIEPTRAAVVRGKVGDRDGNPMAGVSVRVAEHTEYGTTTTRPDGTFDLAVNGGGLLVLRYAKTGYLPAEREVTVPWRDYVVAPDVVLVAYDSVVTTVEAAAPTMQIVRGAPVSDADGTRRATLLIPPDTHATMHMPNGTTSALHTLHVRATEYTVGDSGEEAMPADLPPTSAYTYAVDYSVDEAVAAGAKEVRFDRPVAAYVENFLNFAAGSAVPVGSYDSTRHAWVAEDNGIVIAVVSETAGKADLDVTGDGVADTGAALTALGVTDEERQRLADLYEPGAGLWRVRVAHFSPWDYNWPFGLPAFVEEWLKKLNTNPASECDEVGSQIGCEGQTLGELVTVTGTPVALHYGSNRTPGFAERRTFRTSLTDGSPPSSLTAVVVEVTVAGRRFDYRFNAEPDLDFSFTWDGEDAYGRPLQGAQTATVRIGYVYPVVPYSPIGVQSFGRPGGSSVSVGLARPEITLYQQRQIRLGGLTGPGLQGIGGWTLTEHHSYDPDARMLYLGDGGERSVSEIFAAIDTVAGTGAAGSAGEGTYSGDGGPATAAGLGEVRGVAVAPDGAVYLADTSNGVVRRITTAGTITTFAGGGTPASGNGDGGQATAAALTAPVDVAVGPDGSVFIADLGDEVVRRVAPGGVISTVAGGGAPADGLGDGGAGTAAALSSPRAVAVGPQSRLYIADTGHDRIRVVTAEGTISTLAGGGTPADALGDGLPGPQAKLRRPHDVVAGRDGGVYIADTEHNRVRLVQQDGRISTVAGNGVYGAGGDGSAATAAQVGYPTGLAFDVGSETLYIVQRLHHRVRVIGSDGVVVAAVGSGTAGFDGDEGPAPRARLREPGGAAVGPDGTVYVTDTRNFRLRAVKPPVPGFGLSDFLVPAADGTEVYRFNHAGRHLQTLDPLMELVVFDFDYDSSGRLVGIEDRFGNRTEIEWNAAGTPIAIVGPFGRRTELTVDADGYLSRIENAMGEAVVLDYGAGGLLTSFTTPRQKTSSFEYDSTGRLVKDTGPDGRSTTLGRVDIENGSRVTTTSAEGRVTTYDTISDDSGARRKVVVDPSGARHETIVEPDGTLRAIEPNGTVTARRIAADPRWGIQVGFPESVTMTTPSGATSTATSTRSVSLSDPTDPYSVVTLTDTVTTAGNTTTVAWDAATRTATTTSPEGRTSETTLDEDGLPISQQYGTMAETTFVYDTLGRLTSTTTGTGATARTSTLTYDADSDVVTVTDPLHSYDFTHDAVGRLLSVTLPDGEERVYDYDDDGNLGGFTSPRDTDHGYQYTDGGLVESYTPPLLGTLDTSTSYTYNLDRQPTATALPGGDTIESSYGATTGLLSSVTIDRGTTTYAYDEAARMVGVEAPGDETREFDYDGYLPTSLTVDGTTSGTVAYGYDSQQRLSSSTVNGGPATSYTYDDDGAVSGAGGLSITRDPNNGFVTATSSGGVSTTYDYNDFGELIGQTSTYGGTTTLFDATYVRDDLGRITEKTETVQGTTVVEEYEFDDRGRLREVTRDDVVVETYDYDENGNRLSLTEGATAVTGTYDEQDRLTSYGTASYTYTPEGDVATKSVGSDTTAYAYDERGSLLAVDLPDGTDVDYTIDGGGRRVATSVNGTVTQRLLYGGGQLPVAEVDGSGATVAQFVYSGLGNAPDLVKKNGNTYRVVSDHLGSPRLLVDTANGTVAQQLEYGTFGEQVADTNPGFQPFGYTGGLYDGQAEQVLLGARVYDATIGRWQSMAPVLSDSAYTYVDNDPVNLVDPSGSGLGQDSWNALVGLSEGYTGGLSRLLLMLLGWDDTVDRCSDAYRTAYMGSAIVGVVLGIPGLIRAGIKLGVKLGAKATRAVRMYRASSIFTSSGQLKPWVINNSIPIIRGPNLRNQQLVKALTADGSNIADWAKYTTQTFQGPSKPFQVHFYRNSATGAINYTYDYKVLFSGPR